MSALMVPLITGAALVVSGVALVNIATTPDVAKFGAAFAILGTVLLFIAVASAAFARDDGRYANSVNKSWFDSLKSKTGPCCSDADGTAITDADWESHDGHYRVRLQNRWVDVPDDAVLKEPNRDGRTIVWPYYVNGTPIIRCFIVGVMG